MTTTTRAAIVREPGVTPSIETITLRDLGAGEVLVRMEAAAVCSTDDLAFTGQGLSRLPLIAGHSGVGLVEEIGPEVSRLKVGDRVVMVGSSQCGRCYFCEHGAPSGCVDIMAGMIPARSIGAGADGQPIHVAAGVGVLADRLIQRESNLVAIDASAPAEHAAMLGCGIMSGLGAVWQVAQVKPGDSVAINGCGHLGMWMIQAARIAQAGLIIAVDPLARRREAALGFGADVALDVSEELVDEVKVLTAGRGVDVAIESAGSVDAMRAAVLMSRTGATVVPTGMDDIAKDVEIPNFAFGIGARRISGSQTGGGDFRRWIPEYARLLDDGTLRAADIATAVLPLERIGEGIAMMRERTGFTPIIRFPSA